MHKETKFELRVGYLAFYSILLVVMIQLLFRIIMVFIRVFIHKINIKVMLQKIESNTNPAGNNTPSITIDVDDRNKDDERLIKLPPFFRVIFVYIFYVFVDRFFDIYSIFMCTYTTELFILYYVDV